MIGGEPTARRLPPFNPALLVEQATRRLDLAAGGCGLLAALTARDLWAVGVDRDAQHRAVLQSLATCPGRLLRPA